MRRVAVAREFRLDQRDQMQFIRHVFALTCAEALPAQVKLGTRAYSAQLDDGPTTYMLILA